MALEVALSLAALALALVDLALLLWGPRLAGKWAGLPVAGRQRGPRLKKRYLVVLLEPGPGLSAEGLERAIRRSVAKRFGLISLAKMDPRVVFFDPGSLKAIVRFNAKYKEELLASLADLRRMVAAPLGVAGTLKSARKRAAGL